MTEIEKLYSEAFEDGIDYAIQRIYGASAADALADYENGVSVDSDSKEFAREDKTKPEPKKENFLKRGWNKFKEDIWETGKGLRDGEGDAKKLNWKRLGKRAGVIGGGTALVAVPTALAIRHHNKKKAAEAEAEKNYSEGFEDGVEYAQRTYGIVDTLGRKFRKLTGRETVKDRVLDVKDKIADKWGSLSKLQKAGVIAVPVAATGTGIAISKSGKKKD